MMKVNMGTYDRLIRLILAAGVIVLYMIDVISGVQAVVLGILAVILVVTGFMGFCPIYFPLNISTHRKKSAQSGK
jgi:hypothetical protein